jgi:hypothetical protein
MFAGPIPNLACRRQEAAAIGQRHRRLTIEAIDGAQPRPDIYDAPQSEKRQWKNPY